MTTHALRTPKLYGLVAEFADSETLLAATERAHKAGYRVMDAYTPFPIEGLSEAIGKGPTRLPWIVLAAGLSGALFGLGLQTIGMGVDYPLNIGGRPLFSWQYFVPIIFECTILFSAFTCAIAMILMNGLPKPYHPIFNTPDFDRASQDRFFLCIEASDPQFDRQRTRQFLEAQRSSRVSEVDE